MSAPTRDRLRHGRVGGGETAKELLVAVRANLALMLDEGRIDRAGMRAYARRWLLEDEGYVDRVVENLCERQWPPYESCYPEGLQTCRRFVGGDAERFGQLLRKQLTPATLNRRHHAKTPTPQNRQRRHR